MLRKTLLLTGATTFLATTISPLPAQPVGVQGAAEREIRRREMTQDFSQAAVNKGTAALIDNDYESAFAYFKSAVDALPAGGEASFEVREVAMDGFKRSVIKLTEQRISEGRFEDAETTVRVVLDERYDSEYGPALDLLAKIQEPDRFNKTITPGFVADVEQVKQLFREAEGFYQSGRFDLAFKRCEQILNIDKYNIAARRMMEKVNGARQNYAENAYNTTRSELYNEVKGAWELPVRKFDVGSSQIIEQPVIDARGTTAINRKLDDIRIPSINFRESTVREALDFIKLQSRNLDLSEPDPNKRGVNIVLKLDPATQGAEAGQRITLSLTDVPLREAINYIASAASLKTKVEPYAVKVVPLSEPIDVLITKEYKVQPGFITNAPAAGGDADAGGFGGGGFGAPAETVGKSGAREFLEAQGVQFPEGATANFLPSASKLIVRNTQPNLDLIDQLVEFDSQGTPSQVSIESKFVEITQDNLKELGFDWQLGQFGLPFGSGVYGGGGTSAPGQSSLDGAFPITSPNTGLPIGATSATTGSLTGGNRSGSTAISANAIDGLLFASPVGPAPGVLALAGVFSNPQFQVVLRALNQQKGIDLLSAPSVTTKSGQRATIQLVREFRYPVQFDPPQIPQTTGDTNVTFTPTTPSQFETRNIGVELEVEPTVGPDGFTIELNLSPRVTEFDGFVNYGSPISTIVQPIVDSQTVIGLTTFLGSALGNPTEVLLSENVINQPVFSVRQVTTQVSVYDGQTVVLGGLMREDIQKVEDKTPIIGDIPLIGRLFRSSADQHIKRNLIMFVTASLLDPAGQPLLKEIEDDEIVAAPDPDLLGAELIADDPASIPSL
ncbi:MAG: Amuc_1098 family type IV pilus outer membrane protein [Chthoniobacterales bacterium]